MDSVYGSNFDSDFELLYFLSNFATIIIPKELNRLFSSCSCLRFGSIEGNRFNNTYSTKLKGKMIKNERFSSLIY